MILYISLRGDNMTRRYLLTREQMESITELNDKKIFTGNNKDFQKFLLELKRNISIGNNEYGELFRSLYIDDPNVDIRIDIYGHEDGIKRITINPRANIPTRFLLGPIAKKIAVFLSLNSDIISVNISDMIIDKNALTILLENQIITKMSLENCHFESNFSLMGLNIEKLNLTYCTIPNLKLISELSAKQIVLNKCKILERKIEPLSINATNLNIMRTDFYTDDFFYKVSFRNLKSITIDKKVFKDTDLIMLERVAPLLKNVSVTATLNDLATLNQIDITKYYKLENDSVINYSNIEANGCINFSLKNKRKIRNDLINRLTEAGNSMYHLSEGPDFYLKRDLEHNSYFQRAYFKQKLRTKVENYIKLFGDDFNIEELLKIASNIESFPNTVEKYLKIQDKEFAKFIEKNKNRSMVNAYTNAYDNGFKYAVNKIVKKYYEELQKLDNEYSDKFYEELEEYRFKLGEIDINETLKKTLMAMLEDVILFKKIKVSITNSESETKQKTSILFNCLCPNKNNSVVENLFPDLKRLSENSSPYYSYYMELKKGKLLEMIADLNNNQKFNYDLKTVLSIMNYDLKSNVWPSVENSYFIRMFKLDNNHIKKASYLMEKGLSGVELSKALGFNKYKTSRFGIIMKENKITDNPKVDFETYKECKLNSMLNYYFKEIDRPLFLGRKLVGYCNSNNSYLSRYSEVESLMQQRKDIAVKDRFVSLFKDQDLNEADYKIFLDCKYNKGIYVYRTTLYILKNLFEQGMVLSKEDYQSIKNHIVDNYNKDELNMLTIMYEVIRHITSKYPLFIERYLGEEPIMVHEKKKILTIDDIYRKDRKPLTDYIEKSRTDRDFKTIT